MAGMATMGNGRQTTTAAAMAANRSKTMAPNLPAEDPTRVSKMGGRYLFQKYLRVGRERKVCSQDSSPVFLPRRGLRRWFSFPFSCAALFCRRTGRKFLACLSGSLLGLTEWPKAPKFGPKINY